MGTKLSMKKRFLLLLVPLVILGLAISGIAWKSIKDETGALLLSAHVTRLAVEFSAMSEDMADVMQRGILFPEDKGTVKHIATLKQQTMNLFEELNMIVETPDTVKIANQLEDLFKQGMVPIADQIVKLAADGKIDEAKAQFRTVYAPLSDQFKESATALEIETATDSTNIADRVHSGIKKTALVIILSLVFGLTVFGVLLTTLGFKISKEFTSIIVKLVKNAGEVSGASHRISSTSEELSLAANKQASALEETTASVEEISAMVAKTAENAQQSRTHSEEGYSTVTTGKQVVDDASQSIGEIQKSNTQVMKLMEESNRQMSEVVHLVHDIATKTTVINDIVFQTKLLSFNASVEAARAGEHGKGFAVVAEEVGNLAQMSGTAAREIEDMLKTSSEKVEKLVSDNKQQFEKLIAEGSSKLENGIRAVRRCSDVFEQIASKIGEVNQLTGEIATASNEQALGIQEITKAMNQLDQITNQNNESSRQTATQSSELSKMAEDLQGVVETLNIFVTGGESVTTHDNFTSSGTGGGFSNVVSLFKRKLNSDTVKKVAAVIIAVGIGLLVSADSTFAKPNYRKELGVKSCNDCHVAHHFDQATTKPRYIRALAMIQNLKEGKGKFAGKKNCYACHTGTIDEDF